MVANESIKPKGIIPKSLISAAIYREILFEIVRSSEADFSFSDLISGRKETK